MRCIDAVALQDSRSVLHMRLHDAAGINAPRPDLEIAVGRQFTLAVQRCQSYLFFGFSSLALVQVAPKSVEMSTCFTVWSLPRRPRSGTTVPAWQFCTVRRVCDDRSDRHRFKIAEIAFIGLVARDHWLDGDAIRCLSHAGTVVIFVAHPDAVEPLRRYRAASRRSQDAPKPWMFGNGCPFMAQTIRLFSSINFDRHAAESAGLLASPDRCGSAP